MDTERQPHLRHSVAILSRGDATARQEAIPQNSRFVHLFAALADVGITARPAIYDESFTEEVRADEAGSGLRAVGSTPSASTALQRAKDFRRVHCQRVERACAERPGQRFDRLHPAGRENL